ncbi:hypothetical protein H0264_30600 [Nocardia huaxiensis]|uniref:Alpha/beta hydrolase family protein n=1 Tax=Nocardia huaxiensis TaxID=2755382 RepID=A0A7D6VAF8_9NOCA|nr:hypothetical protein [Nocardia huaxiensis]QLY29562.1 hypothetical protein H0264_30600 [Nocardia huaxiensis]
MRTEDVLERTEGIRLSMVTQPVALPAGFPDHPADCDVLRHLRVRWDDADADPARADAVITLLPGAIAGARSLQPLARNTLRNLRAAGVTAEVWVIDRRANGVEDHSAIEVAKAEGDYHLAFDYYYGGRTVGGRRFAGFVADRDLAFLAEFGMARTVRDLHEVLVREIPDPDVRAEKIFLGGHSLGGIQAGTYAAWDFDGRPGHEQIAGLIALDTVTHLDPLRLADRPRLARPLGAAARRLERIPAAMRRGLIPRSTAVLRGGWGNPEAFAVVAAIAVAAVQAPDEETDILRLLPDSGTPHIALRGSTARTWREFLTGTPDYRKLRLTNRALLGLFSGAHTSMNFAVLSMSCGTLDSENVAPRTFPIPFEASRIPGLRPLYQAAFGTAPRYSPTSFEELYHWRDYDRCGTGDAPVQPSRSGVPAATAASEVVSIAELAGLLAGGRLNVFEDYFPNRQSLDAAAVFGGCRSGSLAPVRHEAGAARLPYINLMGASSFTNVITRWGVYPENTHWFPGYLHCDVAAGADPRADGSPEPVAASLADFVRATISTIPLAS